MSPDLIVGILSLIAAVLALPKIGVKRFFAWAVVTILVCLAWNQWKPREDFASENNIPQIAPAKYVPAWHSENEAGSPYKYSHSYPIAEILIHTQRSCSGNTLCDDWDIKWQAPGPVSEVRCETTFGWEGVETQSAEGPHLNIAHCHGWINGSNGNIKMNVSWKQKW
jgi:hypothetical protein